MGLSYRDGGLGEVVWVTDGRIQGSGTATSFGYVERRTPPDLLSWLIMRMYVIGDYDCLCCSVAGIVKAFCQVGAKSGTIKPPQNQQDHP